ncbi:MAG: PmoA family protein [Acidobacteria bacterium]|nr:PmoA family protein [Acidobacteriota bacterium]
MKSNIVLISGLMTALFLLSACPQPSTDSFEIRNDEAAGNLSIQMNGREVLIYRYGEEWDIVHYWPMNSPSGKNMLVQKTEPYPHHRSFWFADTVSLDGGRQVSTYNALYSGKKVGENDYGPPFMDRIRHQKISRLETAKNRAEVMCELVWEMDGTTPLLDETRTMIFHDLGGGEFMLDVTFVLKASYGNVEFQSDDMHYAWPYLRLHTVFNGENGGTIVSDMGARGQEATNMLPALWIDYSSMVDGVAEGVAVFQWPDGEDHRWLTREYGCFGPRRADRLSGKPFILEKGFSIKQRISVLVHSGDVAGGRVAERYQQYIKGLWQ